ncbi:Periplasmic oligopeptide-binding protein precursor [Serratia quinivorans]|jgi:oligopeptide transport system substrate-binding protein|uniref:ABC transporter substrate-binding protein n=1 Tax=Serratia TaxID=613 RepID=UPI002179749D|nr:ABC transporter substrate-binding protein [Serratia quinivorans]CAI0781800.1 Periplasmic oligopeptide-binding protein precursor [Serratia quinivorans]CAI0799687.1 Periplasmic oligopeptide-binding protein precursor [Serratia quinivorans]CAI0976629.1 Periplasmic oligopeptide-binding protein precursor [Serratia quinivorans]CAI1194768.1 Periplasmic oligopeptide-binding protein precursor [Serratia quinivorans]CAI1590777.1 Periplasmic oligopeptide-binding protein precursor [Serratia quinivorans]
MQQTLKHTPLAMLIAGLLSISAVYSAQAADVPAGVQLAEQQKIVINNGSEVASLDPHKVEGIPESNIILNLLEGLVSTDANGHVVAAAATNWENQDFKTWTFHLRPDAVWSDGSPVTAQDFVYSWQRLADPKIGSPYASYLQYAKVENIDAILTGKQSPQTLGIKAIDDKTLQVTLSEPVPYFISMLSHTSLKPVKRSVVEKFGDKWTLPENYVGNGAYRLKDWVVNERIVLERSPSYWNNKKTVIDQATFLPISSEVSDVNRFRSGEIDITNSAIPPNLFAKMKSEIPEQLHVNPYLCTFYYEINNQRAPFTDARVRAAVKLTLDRDIIANKIMGQGQIPAYSFTPSFTEGAKFTAPEWAGWSQEQRNAEAKKLLAEAGFSAAKPLKFTLLYNTSDQNKQQAIAAASMWKKNLGADVTLRNQEWKTSLESRHQGQYDIARATWCGDYNEPSAFLNLVISNSSINTIFYKSPAFDALMASTLKAPDEAARAALYQQAEAQLDKDSALIPVYYRVSARLIRPSVGGFTGKDPLDYTDVKNLYIIKQ